MLDLERLHGIRLSARPRVQRVVAAALLTPNYYLPPRVRIVFENLERLPAGPVLFAMNHTDRFNHRPTHTTSQWCSHRYSGVRFA